MDETNFVSAVQNSFWQDLECFPAVHESTTRNLEKHGVSKRRRFPVLVILQCLGGYFIEFSAFRIFLDLPVPYAAIEFGKPFSKSGELFSRETANLFFDLVNLAHRSEPSVACLITYVYNRH